MLRPKIKELKKAIIALQIYQEMKTGAHSNAISLNNCVLKQYTVSGAAGSDFGLELSSSTSSSALEIDPSFGAEIMEAYYSDSQNPMPNCLVFSLTLNTTLRSSSPPLLPSVVSIRHIMLSNVVLSLTGYQICSRVLL